MVRIVLLLCLLLLLCNALTDDDRARIYRTLSQAERNYIKSPAEIYWHVPEAPKDSPVIGSVIKHRYVLLGHLNSGSFGHVFSAIDQKHSHMVAIKVSYQFHSYALKEVELIPTYCERGHCIHVIDSFQLKDQVFVVLPLMDCDLHSFRNVRKRLDFKTIQSIGYQLALAVKYAFSQGIVQNDLKLENILLKRTGGIPSTLVLLADFGIAQRCSSTKLSDNWQRTTSFYEAPEITIERRGSVQSDIWSFGLVLAEMNLGKPLVPFDNDGERLYAIMWMLQSDPSSRYKVMESPYVRKYFDPPGSFKPFIEDKMGRKSEEVVYYDGLLDAIPQYDDSDDKLFESFYDLISSCLKWDPAKRTTIEEILEHPFFQLS